MWPFKKNRHKHDWSPWRKLNGYVYLIQERHCLDESCNFYEKRLI
jgi:hypothetical protein